MTTASPINAGSVAGLGDQDVGLVVTPLIEDLISDVVNKEKLRKSFEALGRTLDLMFESFDSESSSVVLEIFGAIDDAEATHTWQENSDP